MTRSEAHIVRRIEAPAPAPVSPPEIDASCRAPLLLLFGGAAIWLLAASAFGLVASIKFHSPAFLADAASLSYGRIYPAATNALLYGFALPAGFGVALWLLARLGRVKLAGAGLGVVAALLWNFGVALGVVGVLRGDTSGFEWLEMPRSAAAILFAAYALLGLGGLLTFQRRRCEELYPSQWFLAAALWWFPWIYSTASLLLVFGPVRGVAQTAVQGWFINNLQTVVLGFLGLGAIFYFIPKLTDRPLHSHYLAMFAFWTLALFGSWMGVPPGAPMPAWMPALSTACAALTLIPTLAVAVNTHQTCAGQYARLKSDTPLAFVVCGAFAWILFNGIVALTSVRMVSHVTHFTWFERGQAQLGLHGFFVMTMLGAIYYIVPRLVPGAALSPRLTRFHLGCAFAGTALVFLPLAAGGVRQGLALNHPDVAFTEAMRRTLPFLRVSTLGDLFIAAGNLALVLNLARLLVGCGRVWFRATWKAAAAELPQPAEVTP